jgi:hypothetical protein
MEKFSKKFSKLSRRGRIRIQKVVPPTEFESVLAA